MQRSGNLQLPSDSNGKESTCKAGDTGLSPESGRSPGEKMETHSSILACRNPWTEEPGRLQSSRLQRVGHDWATSLHFISLCNALVPNFLKNPSRFSKGSVLGALSHHVTSLGTLLQKPHEETFILHGEIRAQLSNLPIRHLKRATLERSGQPSYHWITPTDAT